MFTGGFTLEYLVINYTEIPHFTQSKFSHSVKNSVKYLTEKEQNKKSYSAIE